jgi:hypothetical protein
MLNRDLTREVETQISSKGNAARHGRNNPSKEAQARRQDCRMLDGTPYANGNPGSHTHYV